MEYDVIVIGGSFAGLSFGKHASQNGLDVLVIDNNKQIGSNIRTTGIFIKQLVKEMKIPNKFISNKIKKQDLYFPNNFKIRLSTMGNKYFMTYTSEFLRWLADDCKDKGADIMSNASAIGFNKNNKQISVKIRHKNKLKTIKTKYIIGADGATSFTARKFNLSLNKSYLIGMEKVYSGVKDVKKNKFHCFLDYKIAPGYLAWVAPRGAMFLLV